MPVVLFHQPDLFRELGAALSAAIAPGSRTNLVDRFDVLVFLRNVSPAKLLGEGGGSGPPPGGQLPGLPSELNAICQLFEGIP